MSPPLDIHQVVGRSPQPPPTPPVLLRGWQMSFHHNWSFFSLFVLYPHVLCQTWDEDAALSPLVPGPPVSPPLAVDG